VFDITVFSISIDIEMSAGAMDQQQAIMLAADEETMQGMEDSIEGQDKLEQGEQFFDALCLEYQGRRYCLEGIIRQFLRQFWTA
jgi:hypothetical protein